MNNKPILFIDSGIGGFPYCMDFLNKNPRETVYYLADNKHYPYGARSKEELILILNALINKLIYSIAPKIIVLACNTATLSALTELRKAFPDIPFVGTVPAVKPAAEAAAKDASKESNCGKIGVLATKRTIEELKKINLSDKSYSIYGVAAPELVDFIEHQYDDSKDNEKTQIVKNYIDIFRKENVDTIVLGCTHFLFLQEEFRREAAPDLKVFDSIEGISKRIEFLLDEKNLRAENSGQNRLLLTDSKSINPFWEKRARKLQFEIKALDL